MYFCNAALMDLLVTITNDTTKPRAVDVLFWSQGLGELIVKATVPPNTTMPVFNLYETLEEDTGIVIIVSNPLPNNPQQKCRLLVSLPIGKRVNISEIVNDGLCFPE